MNLYELTTVFPFKVTPAKKKAYQEKLEKLVKLNRGKIKSTDDWGNIDLSYDIKKNTTGSFLHFNLELDAKAVVDVRDKLRVDEDIIRYLLVKSSG